MKRIAETRHAEDLRVVGDHARDPAAHRLAADHEPAAATGLLDRVVERLHQEAGWIRRSTLAGFPTPLHVGKFKADYTNTRRCNSFSDALHKRGIHRKARAMRKQEWFRRRLWSIDANNRHHC